MSSDNTKEAMYSKENREAAGSLSAFNLLDKHIRKQQGKENEKQTN